MTTVVSVAQGGTGSNSAALARTALGVPPSAAYDQANTARDQANTARTQANTGYDQANTARGQANTAYAQANAAYGQANSAYGQANSAYGAANTRLSASGGTLSGDLIITGNLTVSGNSTTLNAEILTIEDADVVLLSNVASTPALNAGIIVNRGTSTNTFIRWAENIDEWGWSDNGTTTYFFDDLRQGLITTNTTFGTVNTNITNTNSNAINAYGQANAAYGAANNRVLKAGDTMTGQLNISSGGLLVTGNSNFDSGTLFVDSVNDRIGIGTTTAPTSGGFTDSRVLIKQAANGTTGGALQIEESGSDRVAFFGFTGSSFRIGTSYRSTGTYHPIQFTPAGITPSLHLATDGNVGIGTTSPISKTTITRAVTNTVTLADSNNASHLTLAGSDALVRLQLGCGGTSLGFAGWIQASYDNTGGAFGVEPLLLNPSGGNVGIGTTNPLQKFVVSNGGALGFEFVPASGILQLYNRSTSAYENFTCDAANFIWRPSGTEAMRLNSSGNLGIGTTSPTQKLDVVGNIKTSGTMGANGTIDLAGDGGAGYVASRLILRTHDNYRGTGIFMVGETSAVSNNTFYIGTPYSDHSGGLYFRHTANNYQTDYQSAAFTSAGNTIMYMSPGGNVGIGTNSPSSKLHIAGNTQIYSGTTGYSPPLIFGSETGNAKKAIFMENYWMVYQGHDNEGHKFRSVNSGGSFTDDMTISGAGAVTIPGSLSKGSGSFKIDHPLPEKANSHFLVHSFIEGPQADLIYRGRANLINGIATVNIDTAAGMTEGTFVLLCRDVQCFTSNETDWDNVRGSVSNNILTIECQNASSNATIAWMVIGERQDKHMYDTEWTDEIGKVIVEPEKPAIITPEEPNVS